MPQRSWDILDFKLRVTMIGPSASSHLKPKEGLMSTRAFSHFALIAFSVSGLSAQATPLKTRSAIDHVPGEIVIKFRDEASSRTGRAAVLETVKKRLGASAVSNIHPFVTDASLALVRMKNEALAAPAMKILGGEPAVVYSEPNGIYHALDLPNDPDFQKQWGMSNRGQSDSAGQAGLIDDDIQIVPLWQKGITGKKSTVVAIIDTGIQWDHPDLAVNLYTNPGEIAGNGKDDDGNGFIDDIHGWNFVAEGKNTSDDDNGHGTHCAGVIGAAGNNGVGVAGVNWNVSLMPVKFLDANGGGSLESAVNAINYARMMKVNVMSNSWGGSGYSAALHDAIAQAGQQGILFVAAAGNDGVSNDGDSPSYPASFDLPNIVSVAAIDNRDTLADFSNHGVKRVHVAAPGVNVYSTYLGSAYKSLSGTSMATPHVAGISALLFSEHPEWTFDVIKERLIKTSTPVQQLRRKVMAGGRVSAYNAYSGIVPPNPDPAENLWKVKNQVIESIHPYANDMNQTWTVQVPGAKYLRLHFEKIDTEPHYDALTIETPDGQVVDKVSGGEADYVSEYTQGDTLMIRMKSDSSVQHWGFKMDKVEFIMETSASR
jgi:thermitase